MGVDWICSKGTTWLKSATALKSEAWCRKSHTTLTSSKKTAKSTSKLTSTSANYGFTTLTKPSKNSWGRKSLRYRKKRKMQRKEEDYQKAKTLVIWISSKKTLCCWEELEQGHPAWICLMIRLLSLRTKEGKSSRWGMLKGSVGWKLWCPRCETP